MIPALCMSYWSFATKREVSSSVIASAVLIITMTIGRYLGTYSEAVGVRECMP